MVGFSISGFGLKDQTPGVEDHRQTFARTLRVPDHAHAPIAGFALRLRLSEIATVLFTHNAFSNAHGAQGFFNCNVDSVELMIARHLLDQCSTAVVFKDDEVQSHPAQCRGRRGRRNRVA